MEAGDGTPQDAQCPDKAEAVRILGAMEGRLMHEGADSQVRQQEPVDLLDHLTRVLTTQRAGVRPLVDLDLVQGGLDLPALTVGARQQLGREGLLVPATK